ncbi:Chitinase-like protein 1 [Ananas comosus]|uniref:chitinase n=1 Tax=Ananas comosus TaxID=4615 RepID=A0A199V6R5_ANACO|nr:Chitinase-like protein 1 [Ananas comosus]
MPPTATLTCFRVTNPTPTDTDTPPHPLPFFVLSLPHLLTPVFSLLSASCHSSCRAKGFISLFLFISGLLLAFLPACAPYPSDGEEDVGGSAGGGGGVLLAGMAMVEAKAPSRSRRCATRGGVQEQHLLLQRDHHGLLPGVPVRELFSKRNAPVAHAVGFWDYQSFITAAALYEPLGFGTTGGKQMQMKEVALPRPCRARPLYLSFVGGYGVATGGPLAWGLCYNHEMSPSQIYCDSDSIYRCVEGAEYYGRGALPVFWNFNYGTIGEALNIDLLHHPEYLEQNATLAFQAAIWRWMNPIKKKQPSAHDAFVGNWKPTKNDTLAKRLPGFGTTMNILYGDQTCGQGFVDSMNNIISHYQYYLDLMGVGREQSGDNLDCAEQEPFNPSSQSATS